MGKVGLGLSKKQQGKWRATAGENCLTRIGRSAIAIKNYYLSLILNEGIEYMDVKHFNDPAAADNLKALFKASRAIPFFGTGFTRNCTAKNGTVPDANKLADLITRSAASKDGLDDARKAQILSIKDLKTAFEFLVGDRYIQPKQRQALLGNLFSKVRLGSNIKRDILNFDWPHIFSFNIDDAIEGAVKKYEPILPNRPVNREFISSHNCLFKIHGDIGEYIKYDDPNVIFTWRQYAESIRTNTAMLTFLEQAQHFAFLFIGCSLEAEFDLLHVNAKRQFENSIYFKCGEVTVAEELRLESYGINQVITFDDYEQIYVWLYETLKDEQCHAPYKDMTIEDSLMSSQEAIEIIAHGGPLITDDSSGARIGKKLKIFPRREEVADAVEILRSEQYLFITGRRFSGKTAFLLQLLGELQHYSFYFYASSDVFNADLKRLVNGVDQTVFFFDSNYLDVEALNALLGWSAHHTNRFVICSSSGDAEILRYTFQKRNAKFIEKKVQNALAKSEVVSFNNELARFPLPDYILGENFLNFAYKYYSAYKSTLSGSTIFSENIEISEFKILILGLAFGKATDSLVQCVHPYFDFDAFIKKYDRLFEVDCEPSSGRILICNSNSWLITRVEQFIQNSTEHAIDAVSQIIASFVEKGFKVSAYSLITFNKLNEICGGGKKSDPFIRGIYQKVEAAFEKDEHYWLQRAKCELVMGVSANSIKDGIRFAMPLRINNEVSKNQTFYSATLILAQLFSRMYKFERKVEFLLEFLKLCTESIKNYQNNKRHIDKVVSEYKNGKGDINFSINSLASVSDVSILVHRKEVNEVLSFFKG